MSSATSVVAPIRRAALMRATRNRSAIDDQPSAAHCATRRAESDVRVEDTPTVGVFSSDRERADDLGVA